MRALVYDAYTACAKLYNDQPTLSHWRLMWAVNELVQFVETHSGILRQK